MHHIWRPSHRVRLRLLVSWCPDLRHHNTTCRLAEGTTNTIGQIQAALATLRDAAAETASNPIRAQQFAQDNLMCSWGERRNAPFAAAYNAAVPATFHVINDQDTICWWVFLHTCWLCLLLRWITTSARHGSDGLLCYRCRLCLLISQ